MGIKYNNITNKNIAHFLSAELFGLEKKVLTIDAFPNCKPKSISFLKDRLEKITKLEKDTTIITQKNNLKILQDIGVSVILSKYPKYDFSKVYNKFFNKANINKVHKNLITGSNVEIDENVNIGPNVVIGNNVKIERGAEINANTIFYDNIIISKNVKILSGSVIGGRAFSFGLKDDKLDKNSYRMPSVGYEILEEGVEIGNNCVISRGVFENTVIKKNTKINDLVHIGNSVLIKENTLIMANVDISARVEIGSECWIAQSSCIQQGVKVGNNVQVGMGSVVTKNVRENSVVYGNPAKFIRSR